MRVLFLFGLVFCCSCSSNSFEPLDKADPAEAALAAMDSHKSDEAIRILEGGLRKNEQDWILVSLLASAKAQKAGVDTTDIALQMAEQGGESASGNAITALFTVLPPASADIIALLAESTALLASIPNEELVEGDLFKISIFNTALTALQAKLYDANGDGKFTVEELLNLDEKAAISILESLLNAENAASIYQSSGGSATSTGSVSQIRTQIDAETGANQAEKLKSFLGKSKT